MMGMRHRRVARLLAALGLAASAPAAFGLCAGFTDVDGAPPFCPAVDWLRNRAITLGCTSTTLFCPQNPVTRLQMAAFMNRLGNALTPAIVYQHATGATLAGTPYTPVCMTGDVAAASYPRTASLGAVFNMLADAATEIELDAGISLDGGATWQIDGIQQEMSGSGTSRWVAGTTWTGNQLLEAGEAYRFALLVTLKPGAAQPGAWSCQLKAIVASTTGVGPPY